MLRIIVPESPPTTFWDEAKEEFIPKPAVPVTELLLEHSLVSLSKWESATTKPFLTKEPKTAEETLLYIKCMTLNKKVSDEVYNNLTSENMSAISTHIDSKMTATTFTEVPGTQARNTGEFVTAEIIYYWMITLTVPVEFENWHLNRLLALIKVLNLKNSPPKKTGRREGIANRRILNRARKEQLNTNG
jgi:hypothetical protein